MRFLWVAALSMTMATAAAAAGNTSTDTTLQARKGVRLYLNNFGGNIAIEAWRKDAIHLMANHSDRVKVVIVESGPDIQVQASTRRRPANVDYRIQVPEWLPLNLEGIHSNIRVKGVRSDVLAETVHGLVSVEGGEGLIRLSSLNGPVSVVRPRGRVEASSINEAVRVIQAQGEVMVNAVNGDVDLEGIDAGRVEVQTVNGDVRFVGELRKDGQYDFSTHQGDLMIGIPDDLDATISVATFNGEFESVFPVRPENSRFGRRFHFAMGKGNARMSLESFGGSIRLVSMADALREAQLRQREWLESERERAQEELEEAKERERERREEQKQEKQKYEERRHP